MISQLTQYSISVQPIQIRSTYKKLIADTATPVALFLKLRDTFPNSILLESSDYHGNENSFSFICCVPQIGFKVEKGRFYEVTPQDTGIGVALLNKDHLPSLIQQFCKQIRFEPLPLPFIHNGLFGYTSYNAVQHFEDITLKSGTDEIQIPDMQYHAYGVIIAINHFNDELYICCHNIEGAKVQIDPAQIERYIHSIQIPSFHFETVGNEVSNYTDAQFLEIIRKGKEHCFRGDVFQIVLSRRFKQQYSGDDFNLYRALRSINPSPYLYFFDYGSFRIFGSSPEAQLIIKDNKSIINPIAGTFRRTGNDNDDAVLAQKLSEDPKENAEHVMLVDLARNDLSRNGTNVYVETYKEVQYYSHVIHLVSKVVGEITEQTNRFKIVADTFPAGTLSGAPKHMAMRLIDQYEQTSRSFYGGCIGYMSFTGDFNQAIMIRSFLSKNNTLYFQAGAGVVADSKDENELQEVHNKLAALKKALTIAGTI